MLLKHIHFYVPYFREKLWSCLFTPRYTVFVYLLLLFLLPPPAHAQDLPPAPDPTLTLTAESTLDGNYVPYRWLAIQVTLANTGPDRVVHLRSRLPSDSPPRAYTQQVVLPQRSEKQITLYLPMQSLARIAQITVVPDSPDAPDMPDVPVLASTTLDLFPRIEERLLGIVSDQPLTLALPRRQDLDSFPFVVVPLAPADLPSDPRGLDSLTILLLHDTDTRLLSPTQQQALLAWVARGGHLVLGGGEVNRATPLGLDPALQPATLGAEHLLDVRPLRLITSAPPRLIGSTLTPLVPARPFGVPEAPLFVQRMYGAGLVTQLAFSPTQRTLRTWDGAPALWDWLLSPARRYAGRSGLEADADTLQSSLLAQAAADLPASNLPRSSPVFGLLMAYLLFVGPVLAVLLRRLDRQPLTWLLVPTLAVLTGAGGALLALQLRADQRIISHATLLEATSPNAARSRTATLLLAPQATQFVLRQPPDTLLRPLDTGQVGGVDFGSVADDLAQQSDTQPLTVARWQAQGILAEQTTPISLPHAAIILDPQGVRVELDNVSDQPLSELQIRYGPQQATLTSLPAGAHASVPLVHSGLEPPPAASSAGIAALGQAATPPEQEPLLPPVPRLMAVLPEAPAPLTVAADAADAAATQQRSLLSMPVELIAQGQVDVPEAWFEPDLSLSAGGVPCLIGGQGGLLPQTDTLTLTMRLPDALAALDPVRLRVSFQSNTVAALDRASVRLYDWQQHRLQAEARPVLPPTISQQIAMPQRVVQHGRVLFVFTGAITDLGCIRPMLELQGVLP